MQTVTIDLGERSYPILIGAGLLARPAAPLSAHVPRRAMVVTNDRVAPLYLERTLAALGDTPSHHVILPDGEAHKHLATLDAIYEALLSNGFDRGGTVVALGGGVIGDMAGFAAASYQRGVDFVQVPTTLLAQVDSSVGGKTGVNHALGKNMIGAFHQPVAVVADTDTLETLDGRELAAGLAEVIKYGLITDAAFLGWLERHLDELLAREPAALARAIARSCEIKARIVEQDEREQGRRALLNLGHTFGHAIEAAMGYGRWLHGEAVAAGTAMALDLSVRGGLIDAAFAERATALLARAGLPIRPPAEIAPATFLDFMRRDKKVSDGALAVRAGRRRRQRAGQRRRRPGAPARHARALPFTGRRRAAIVAILPRPRVPRSMSSADAPQSPQASRQESRQDALLSETALAALGLARQPFADGPDGADGADEQELFADEVTTEQLADIRQALITGDDLLLVLGERGAGKSTLLGQLAADSGLRIQCFSVRGGPRFSTRNLFVGMLEAFKVRPPEKLQEALDELIPCLQAMVGGNTLCVVALDDAQAIAENELTTLLGSMLYPQRPRRVAAAHRARGTARARGAHPGPAAPGSGPAVLEPLAGAARRRPCRALPGLSARARRPRRRVPRSTQRPWRR